MKKSIIKIISIIIAVLMLLGTVSLGTFAETEEFEYVYFGLYPQSEVKDSTTLAELNKLSFEWKSYGYYSGDGETDSMKSGDWMKYSDVSYDGEKYRAVSFSQYRPISTHYEPSIDNSCQAENGYYINTTYWFKYEPLKWRILDKEKGLIISEYIIDSQAFSNVAFSNDGKRYNSPDCTNYLNDYCTSSIRKWLNEDFYNTAFSDEEKSNILTTHHEFVKDPDSLFVYSEETYGNVFLLSYNEVQNENYGFTSDETRIAYGSDYAKCQGAYMKPDWIVRSSNPFFTNCICGVDSNRGYVYHELSAIYLQGIRPAISLKAMDNSSDEKESNSCSHICHKTGISAFFYKIALFFWKLFKINKECSCGIAHY